MRPEAPGVWAEDLIPNFAIIGNYRLGDGQGCYFLEGPGMGWNPYRGAQPTTWLVLLSPQSKNSLSYFIPGRQRIIYN